MSKYTGYECFSCGKKFTDEDDVVVCPECGTPYHRECYVENEKCINYELHEKGESWQEIKQEESVGENSDENKRCPRCGFENTADKLFCEKCGMPLITPDNAVPFNDNAGANGADNSAFSDEAQSDMMGGRQVFNQDTDIDGVRLGDYARYVGGNPFPFLAKFIRFGKYGKKIAVNIFAFLLPHVYFFYRKMYKWGALFMSVLAVLMVPRMAVMVASGIGGVKFDFGFDINSRMFLAIANLTVELQLVLQLVASLVADYIYYKQARRDITNIYSAAETNNPDDVKDTIANKGGVSWAAAIVGFTVYTVISFAGMVLLKLIK